MTFAESVQTACAAVYCRELTGLPVTLPPLAMAAAGEGLEPSFPRLPPNKPSRLPSKPSWWEPEPWFHEEPRNEPECEMAAATGSSGSGRPHMGLEETIHKLVQQQSTLLAMQHDLQELVLAQHESLEKRLSGFAAAPHPEEFSPANGAPVIHHVHLHHGKSHSIEEATEQIDKEAIEPSPAHSVRKFTSKKASQVFEPKRSDKPKTLLAWCAKRVRSPLFEAIMGAVLVLNFAVLFTELEMRGDALAQVLQLKGNFAGSWSEKRNTFQIIETCFLGVYLFELILRLLVYRMDFVRDLLNVFDGTVVVVSSIDSFILTPLMEEHDSSARLITLIRLIRITRALRLLRFLRVLRLMGMFSALRVLVNTISMSMSSLLWSMAVVGFIILASAMLMVQLTSPFIEDDRHEDDLRQWVYLHYGSVFRASYSMFEATFSGKWATHLSRPLIHEVSPLFSLFWVIYTVAINFAVIRVIAALFLKQTMDVAKIDDERTALMKMQETEKAMETLSTIFKMGDQLGDGVLHRWEFEDMMERPDVLKMFQDIDLEAPELCMLYNLLSEDDGVVDEEEFLTGAMKLRSNVRTMDMIQLMHDQIVLRRSVDVIKDGLEWIDRAIHPGAPWKAKRDIGKYQPRT